MVGLILVVFSDVHASDRASKNMLLIMLCAYVTVPYKNSNICFFQKVLSWKKENCLISVLNIHKHSIFSFSLTF